MLLERCRALTACVAALGVALMLMIGTRPAAAAALGDLSIWVPDYYGGLVYYDQLNYATSTPAYSTTSIDVSNQSCNPNSLAISGGLLYIVCSSGNGGNDQILVYNATTRTYVKTITGLGTDNNNYFTGSSLIAILFDSHGNLWVSGYNTNDLLRIPASQLSSQTPLVDRQVIDSPDSPAGMALDTDNSIWIVGQYDNGIVLNFPDSVLNQPGTFLGGTALSPNPTYCVSNDVAGCQPVGLFNNPEGVAVLDGNVFVSNNGGNAPAASLVELTKVAGGTTVSTTVIGGTVGRPFSCPGGLFTITLPTGIKTLWVNDEGYQVNNTDCGASSADQGNTVGRVLQFTSTELAGNAAAPNPVEFPHWAQIYAGSPGFGGIVVQATAQAQSSSVTVSIDVSANRHVINPLIYGTGFATKADLVALGAPLDRRGGDNTTRYNWRQNATNLADDYFFESYPDTSAVAGADADSFIRTARAAKSAPMITIPMLGWVAKLGANRSILASFSVKKYGPQCEVDPYDTDAGDGIKPDCKTFITGNDPNDANIKDAPAQEKGWVQHLVNKWGTAAKGGVGYYLTDNEPSIWYSTHRDVHPVGPHATEFRDKVLATAAMIRSVDPTAKIVGPEEWGWEGYFYSGYDQQYSAAHNYNGVFPDRQNEMGGLDYYPWLLKQWKSAHPIDVLSAHFYPQGNEFSDDVSTATQLLRNRSTRQLWDPNYVSESWIDDKVMLIPRMKQWVSADYVAGTPIAITEYNWGAESHINGATTQADIFGIFGREGLDMATRFTVPAASTPTYKAIEMYRNYDGAQSQFGDVSVAASVPNPDNLSAFAAVRRSDGALTVMVIAKQLTGATQVTLDLAHFKASGIAKAYQLTAANAIKRIANQTWAGGSLVATVPAQSITLFVLAK